MDTLITWMHYASTFFLSLGIILFVRYIFSSVRLTLIQRETKVYIPAFGFFCLASVSEAVSCYLADRADDFHTTAALAMSFKPLVDIAAIYARCERHKETKLSEFQFDILVERRLLLLHRITASSFTTCLCGF